MIHTIRMVDRMVENLTEEKELTEEELTEEEEELTEELNNLIHYFYIFKKIIKTI
jgi:hypothetical protein